MQIRISDVSLQKPKFDQLVEELQAIHYKVNITLVNVVIEANNPTMDDVLDEFIEEQQTT